jgi:uncharacterized NAD(P)/FAD-binding protein YdhS
LTAPNIGPSAHAIEQPSATTSQSLIDVTDDCPGMRLPETNTEPPWEGLRRMFDDTGQTRREDAVRSRGARSSALSTSFVIVGTGFTGTAVLVELADQFEQSALRPADLNRVQVTTIEREDTNGPGYPYRPENSLYPHLLNQAATQMALKSTTSEATRGYELAEWRSDDFVDWLQRKRPWIVTNHPQAIIATHPGTDPNTWTPDPTAHYPRFLFGLYLQDKFIDTVERLRALDVQVSVRNRVEVIDGKLRNGRFALTVRSLANGARSELRADQVLLATGRWIKEAVSTTTLAPSTVFERPYPAAAIVESVQPTTMVGRRLKEVLVLGMGLSAIDTVLTFATGRFHRDAQGNLQYDAGPRHAQVTVVSRTGYFPIVRGLPAEVPKARFVTAAALDQIKCDNDGYLTLTALKALFEKEIESQLGRPVSLIEHLLPDLDAEQKLSRDLVEARRGSVIYALSKEILSLQLYAQLAPVDKDYFTTHLRTYFLQSISAMPIVNAEKLLALFRAGVVGAARLGPGRINVVRGERRPVQLRADDEVVTEADYLVKAIGDDLNIVDNHDKFIRALLTRKEIIPAAGGGMRVDPVDYSVLRVDDHGHERVSECLSALGLPVMDWLERDFASASIKAAQPLVQRWMQRLAVRDDGGSDEAVLLGLNDDYLRCDQHGDVDRYEQLLAPDFTAAGTDQVFRNRREFLDLIGQPRPFENLTLIDVHVRFLGDVALIHGRVSYTTTHDRSDREALYTDTYQRRDGRWLCVAGEVVVAGTWDQVRDQRRSVRQRSG